VGIRGNASLIFWVKPCACGGKRRQLPRGIHLPGAADRIERGMFCSPFTDRGGAWGGWRGPGRRGVAGLRAASRWSGPSRCPACRGRIDHLSHDPAGGATVRRRLGQQYGRSGGFEGRTGQPASPGGLYGAARGGLRAGIETVCMWPAGGRRLCAPCSTGRRMRSSRQSSWATMPTTCATMRPPGGCMQATGGGALGIIDAAANQLAGDNPVGRPSGSFFNWSSPAVAHFFVNLPGSHTIAVVDRTKRQVRGRVVPGPGGGRISPWRWMRPHQPGCLSRCRVPAPACLVFDNGSGQGGRSARPAWGLRRPVL